MKQTYLEAGKICGAHGVKGAVKVEPWCDSPKVLATRKRVFLKSANGVFTGKTVRHGAVLGGFVLLELEGLNDRDAAFAMKDRIVFLHRDDVPLAPGAALLADLIGLPVTDADTGKVYGTVREVNDVPQGQMFTVSTPNGDVLFPGIPPFLIRTDADEGILVRPIPGFFDEAEEIRPGEGGENA